MHWLGLFSWGRLVFLFSIAIPALPALSQSIRSTEYNRFMLDDSIARAGYQTVEQDLHYYNMALQEICSFKLYIHDYTGGDIPQSVIQNAVTEMNQNFNAQGVPSGAENSMYYENIDTSNFNFTIEQIVYPNSSVNWVDWNSPKRPTDGGAAPVGDYINIWLTNTSDSILGYAQYPGGLAQYDGIVLSFNHINSSNLTQLMGAFFGLKPLAHPDGCIDDGVLDTPIHHTSMTFCVDESIRTSCDRRPIMSTNFMNSSPSDCKYMFTEGQVARMRKALYHVESRKQLITSN